MTIHHDSPLYTIPEAAKYLNMSRSSIYRVLEARNVPTIQLLPGKRYITQATLDALIANPQKTFPATSQDDI